MKTLLLTLWSTVSLTAAALGQAPASLAGQTLRSVFGNGSPYQSQLVYDFAADGTVMKQRIGIQATGGGTVATGYSAPVSFGYNYTVTSPTTATLIRAGSQIVPNIYYLTFSTPTQGTWTIGDSPSGGPAIFSLSPTGGAPSTRALVNLSVLFTAVQNQPITFGFAVGEGAVFREILIRDVGPSLASFGLTDLAVNPAYQLNQNFLLPYVNSGPSQVGWSLVPGSAATISAENLRAGSFPLTQGSNDKADVYLLPPGNYTVTVSATNASQAGKQLLEVYEVQ